LREFAARASNLRPLPVLDRAAGEALTALDHAGVDALLLKGPVLAQRLYREDEHRSYLDIDLLVDPQQLERAHAVLRGLGYDNDKTNYAGVDDFLGVLHAESWVSLTGCGIDLHWRLAGCDAAPAAAWRLLHDRRQTITVGGHAVSALGDDALALHVATHAAQSGPDDAKAIGDLARALERWPMQRWCAAARLAAELSATEAFAAGLRLLAAGAALAAELGLPEDGELSWVIHHRPSRPRGTFHIRGLRDAPGWAARVAIVRRSLLPTRAWITDQTPWARRGAAWLLAAYALHLARAPSWALRAWRFDRRARRAGRPREP
jgi:hypothetical protein